MASEKIINEIYDREFEVEDIEDSRICNGRKEYFIKWEGYPSTQNTWEPEEHLNANLINSFEEKKRLKNAINNNDMPVGEIDGFDRGVTTERIIEAAKPNELNSAINNNDMPVLSKINGFYQGLTPNRIIEATKSNELNSAINNNDIPVLGEIDGFDRGLTPERIIEATKLNGDNYNSPPMLARIKGFDRGLQAKEIIGATNSSGQLAFLIKWEENEEVDLVLAAEANQKCPEVVISFYEKIMVFKD